MTWPGLRAQDSHQVTLDQIWSAFRVREQKVQTAKVSWKYRFVKSEYAVADAIANEREDPSRAADIVFPEETCRMSLAGERVRFESPIAVFAHGQGGRPTASVSAFDGSEQQFFSESLRRDKPHHGSIRESDAFSQWNMIHIYPLTYALRPLRPELFGPQPGDWQIVDDPAVIDGRRCVVMELAHPVETDTSTPRHRADRVYLDPEYGFRLLRRTAVMTNGQITIQVDARYERGDAPVWFPTSWTVATYGAVTGNLGESSEGRLIRVVLNESIRDEEFRIKFPRDTEVRRIFTPYESQVYVANADGQLLAASPRERLSVPTGSDPWWRSWGLMTAGVVLLALAIGWGICRRRKHV
jgi:hypothetical protein